MIISGVDCGAKNTKTVIVQDGRIIGKGLVPTGFDPKEAVKASVDRACEDAGIGRARVATWVGTGSGKNAVRKASVVNELKAMARAAAALFPEARTVVDVGAEEGRAAKIDAEGRVIDFAINEKCAAGAGSFIEAMARALEISVEDMGALSLQSDKTIPMNAQCAIFAESEVVGLIHAKTPKRDISRAIHDAIASRIGAMIRRIGLEADTVLMGGMACNPGFREALIRQLPIGKIRVPEGPEYGMALGAAIVASERG